MPAAASARDQVSGEQLKSGVGYRSLAGKRRVERWKADALTVFGLRQGSRRNIGRRLLL